MWGRKGDSWRCQQGFHYVGLCNSPPASQSIVQGMSFTLVDSVWSGQVYLLSQGGSHGNAHTHTHTLSLSANTVDQTSHSHLLLKPHLWADNHDEHTPLAQPVVWQPHRRSAGKHLVCMYVQYVCMDECMDVCMSTIGRILYFIVYNFYLNMMQNWI